MDLNGLRGKLFSVSTDGKFIVICVLGVKLSIRRIWKYHIVSLSQLLFAPRLPEARPNSVLVFEPNEVHGEVVAGFVSYFLDMGYNVDVALRHASGCADPLCRVNDDRVRCFILTAGRVRDFISDKERLDRYRNIFITSHVVYAGKYGPDRVVFDVFPELNNYRNNKIVVVEHHLERADAELLKNDRVVTLADLGERHGRRIRVNPHRFGAVAKTPRSGGRAVFVIVGAIEPKRRNYDLLFDALRELRGTGRDFTVAVIGRGELGDIDEEIRGYFDIKGWLSFPKMFAEMERADFFLPLLDPNNPAHDYYRLTGTSGSVQLIYGFAKPCLINEKFAATHCFTSENSLIYRENSDLAATMARAIRMSGDEYAAMQRALDETAREIYDDSMATLKRMMR